MEIEGSLFIFALGLALSSLKNAGAALILQDTRITTITRHNSGDIFTTEGKHCNVETCIGLSSGTAGVPTNGLQIGECACQCHSHLPAFREDLQICVDDIHECVLSPFVSGSMSQQIPFVYLPLKDQIIHPSKEISFEGIQTPVCAVSGAKFLTDGGWIDLRNPLDTDVPFRLFRDEGRTFLRWMGEPELRSRMGGRLVLVHLMCREIANSDKIAENTPTIFTPCVAFRVVGTPEKYLSNVSEVVFIPDSGDAQNLSGGGLSVSEYVAIGICSILLGLIYVASVFLYLHLRRRRKDAEKTMDRRDNQTLTSVEEGIIKSNPLLSLGRHFVNVDTSYSDSCSSDNEPPPDIVQNPEERKNKVQITAAMIHPQLKFGPKFIQPPQIQPIHQESIEKLPEENVSIVETMECREERPDSLKMIGSTRRKLYFNPAYFDPQLLVAPPPAAVEFLTKIREVISLAKQKMASKKFTPSLNGIPEEEPNHTLDMNSDYNRPLGSRRGSAISLKRENSRRKTCSGCPGCEPQDFKALSGKLPEFPSLAACQNCASTNTESKQISIRKWLEDVPIIKSTNSEVLPAKVVTLSPKRIRSPTRSISPDHITPIIRKSSRPSSERSGSPVYDNKTSSVKSVSSRKSSSTVKTAIALRKLINKPKAPPPPVPASKVQNIYDVIAESETLPDMVHEAVAIEKRSDSPKIPTITKKMKAVINELNSLDHTKGQIIPSNVDYDTDSLERSKETKGYSTPTDYAEVSSSQPSPSLSAALPLDEEMTMQNAIINTKTGNMTISKLNMEEILNPDDHDYELIVLKKGNADNSFMKLPELLQRDNGYSLVSEVYVNNGYNYSSTPSTPSGSNCSTLERAPKIIYEQNKPGHLLIEVEDCPDNYIKAEDSDAYEPDTLDRKPKLKLVKDAISDSEYVDSLERPNQILLRTTGTFKKDGLTDSADNEDQTFNRNFGSLREIYEAKNKRQEGVAWKMNLEGNNFEGRILTLEERHCRRQRKSPVNIPPDVIPPNQCDDTPIYERPKPPRKVMQADDIKPPLPPKNGSIRSAGVVQKPRTSLPDYQPVEGIEGKRADISILKNFIHSDDILFKNGFNNQIILQTATITTKPVDLKRTEPNKHAWGKVMNIITKPEDSGYLSTDSNDSHKKKCKDCERGSAGSETDESLGDGHSESGAESIETHSVFFGSYRKPSCVAGSIDSGVGSESKHTKTISILRDKT